MKRREVEAALGAIMAVRRASELIVQEDGTSVEAVTNENIQFVWKSYRALLTSTNGPKHPLLVMAEWYEQPGSLFPDIAAAVRAEYTRQTGLEVE